MAIRVTGRTKRPDVMKLYMVPGAGTDWRMFAPQLEQFPNMTVIPWIAPLHRKEELSSYAKRLAETVDTSSPFVLAGVSLGGMIVQEMARHITPEALIIIASSDSWRAIPLRNRLLGKCMRALPNRIVAWIFRTLASAVEKANKEVFPHRALYADMLRELSPSLIRWQSGAAVEWERKGELPVRHCHIHGTKDKVIPYAGMHSQFSIPDGGHLINVTHAGQVNELIRRYLDRLV